MKAKIFIMAMVLLGIVFLSHAQEKEKAFYKAITEDNTVTDINEVQVDRWTPVPYTLIECDMWIAEWERRSKECLKHAEEWRVIREKVFEEAEKVKLKEKENGSV